MSIGHADDLSATVNPDHYKRGGIELIDLIETLPTNRGNAVKYLVRQGDKGDAEDARKDAIKALWYTARNIFHEFGAEALEEAIGELLFRERGPAGEIGKIAEDVADNLLGTLFPKRESFEVKFENVNSDLLAESGFTNVGFTSGDGAAGGEVFVAPDPRVGEYDDWRDIPVGARFTDREGDLFIKATDDLVVWANSCMAALTIMETDNEWAPYRVTLDD